jgi:perosamine synthetase
MKYSYPLHEPRLGNNELNFVKKCILSGWISPSGSFVNLFEKKLLKFTQANYISCCNSGTSALHISLKVSGLKPNEEVIVPTITFIATINSVLYNNAYPIFMDCDDYLNIDVVKVINFLKEKTYRYKNNTYNKITNRRIFGILVSHIFGNPVDLNLLFSECSKRNIKIIEDAAESLGSYYIKGKFKNNHTGTIGESGALSFNVNKIITTAAGGAVIFKSLQKKKEAKLLINQSKVDDIFFIHRSMGYNYGMTNINAALGFSQINKIKKIISLKRKIHNFYKEIFYGHKNFRLVEEPDYARSNYWLNTLIINNVDYNKFKKKILFLNSIGIQVRPLWKPCHLQVYLKKYEKYKICKANKLFKKVICLPSTFNLKKKDIKIISNKIINAFK